MPFDATDFEVKVAPPAVETPVQRLLREAREMLTAPGVWSQDCQEVGGCGRACVVTAISRVANGVPIEAPSPADVGDGEVEAWRAYESAIGVGTASIPAWNDHPDRSLREVLDGFDRAYVLAAVPA